MKTNKKKFIYASLGLIILVTLLFVFQSLQRSIAMVTPLTKTSDFVENITTNKEAQISTDNNYKNDTKEEIKKDSQDLDVTPEAKITKPRNKTIKGKVELEVKVKEAKNVEFYLIEKGSNTNKYIGSAQKNKNDYWSLEFNSNSFPNGSFYLKAKIKNAYGNYKSNKKEFNINNGVVPLIKKQEETKNISQKDSLATSKLAKNNIRQKDILKTVSQNKNEENNNVIRKNNQIKKEVNYNGLTSQAWQKTFFHQAICQNKNVCGENADPDKDGLTNNEEFHYKTDPLNPDSDRDGYLDGDEIKNGFNPLKYSPGDKSDRIVFESPKKEGIVKKNLYKVTSVKLKKEANKKEVLVLSGKGIPNSFVTVYIYSSQPIILTVETDKNGNWSYTLDKKLENGEHQVYVAVTNNTGKITAKSKPLAFIKTAQAVSVIPDKTYVNTASSANENKKNVVAMIIVFTLISLGLAISIIGLTITKLRKNK